MASIDELLQAIRKGDTDAVEHLLKTDVDINELSGIQGTPLCAAIVADRSDIVQLLLQNNCDVNAVDYDGESPLCLAVSKQRVDCVRALLETRKCNINKIDPVSENTPVCSAVLADNIPIVKLLVEAGCDLNKAGGGRNTALHHAVKQNNERATDVLLKSGHLLDVCDRNGMFPLHLAVISGDLAILQLLLQHISPEDINEPNKFTLNTALHMACRDNNGAALGLLIRHGASVNVANNFQQTPLFLTCFNNNADLTQTLLTHGGKASYICQQDIKLPVTSRRTRSRGNLCKVSPLHLAVLHNNSNLVKILIDHDADILLGDSRGQSPLYYALEESDTNACLTDVLLDSVVAQGKEITGQDHSGQSLMFAAVTGIRCNELDSSVHFVERLADLGCSVNQKDLQGRPVLHRFTYRNGDNVELAEVLLDKGASVNATSDFGFTVLHLCVWEDEGLPAVAPVYVLYGADMCLQNHEGETAFQMALADSNTDMATFLVNCGYNCSSESIVNADDIEDLTVIFHALERDFIEWIFQQAHNPIDLKTLCRKQIIETFTQRKLSCFPCRIKSKTM